MTDRESRRRTLLLGAGAALPLAAALAGRGSAQDSVTPATKARPKSRTDSAGDFNVRDFGAVGDGVRDDTKALQAALDAAGDRGGRVIVPPGIYSARTLTIYTRVHLAGAGMEASILKLRDGVNDDLLKTNNHASLRGSNTTKGPHNWSVRDLTLDGNRAKNTAGCGLRAYGWGYVLSDLRVRQCAGAGIDSEWSTDDPPETPLGQGTPGDSMEAQVVNVKVHDCGAGGILWRGPHDTQFVNCIVYSTKTLGIHIHSGKKFSATGCQLVNCHVWGGHEYGYKIEAGFVTLVNCMAEWAKQAQIHINDGDTTVSDCRFFGSPKAKHVGIEIGSKDNIVYGTQVDARMSDLAGGAFKFTNEGGSSKIKALIYQTSGVAYTGRPSRGSQLEILVNGIETGSETWMPKGSLGWNGGTPIVRHLSAATAWDPPQVAPGSVVWAEVAVKGAEPGDTVAVGFSKAVPPGALLAGAVTSSDVVAVTLLNATGRPLKLGAGTLRADCWVH